MSAVGSRAVRSLPVVASSLLLLIGAGVAACTDDIPAPAIADLPGVVTGGEGGTAILLELIDLLEVVEESPRQGYDRDLFNHWIDADGSGCRARQDVLLAQAIGLVQRDVVQPCTIVEGDWYSLADGVVHAGSPADIDVDHVVALAEAWDSGAAGWTFAMRERFANDPVNLLVMTPSTNRAKADLDAGEWKPPRRDAWCVTASMMVVTKVAYSLTIDRAERNGLIEMARSCDRGGQRTVPGVPLPGSAEFEARARAVLARSIG
jgi:hypothetical protein